MTATFCAKRNFASASLMVEAELSTPCRARSWRLSACTNAVRGGQCGAIRVSMEEAYGQLGTRDVALAIVHFDFA